jgi:hypothetical protein
MGVTSKGVHEDGESAKPKTVEISFDYVKQSGPGSNQYAVWIENDKKEVVKTLFVTSFTTKGRVREGQPIRRGYTYRPTCVPTWVTNSKVAEMPDAALDAFTGATPQSGKQTFTWDFTDSEGKKVAKGKYRIYVEATLKNDFRVLYTGDLSYKAKRGELTLNKEVIGQDDAYAGMIKSVKAIVY